jgi:hypothetical protein
MTVLELINVLEYLDDNLEVRVVKLIDTPHKDIYDIECLMHFHHPITCRETADIIVK